MFFGEIILVLVIGGWDYITPKRRQGLCLVCKRYIQLGDYMLPTTLYKNLKHLLISTPQKSNIDTKNDGLENVSPASNMASLWVSMLDFRGVGGWPKIPKRTLLGTKIWPGKNNIEDDVPFPKLEYVSSLMGVLPLMVVGFMVMNPMGSNP